MSNDPKPNSTQSPNPSAPLKATSESAVAVPTTPPRGPTWGPIGGILKYSAVILIVLICLNLVRKKLQDITWQQLWEGVVSIPPTQLILAFVITALNFVILTGYDWIAITYLQKKLPWKKIMVGAVIGYAFSNVFGWMIGGTTARYRLYTRWGFSLVEVIAFISVLSVTFWLGMFLLAGVALVSLPVHLPEKYSEHLPLSTEAFGYIFLFCVLGYLAAALFIRKPIKVGTQQFTFPPFRLSLVQLSVSAADFALASLVLYLLLPQHDSITYGTVLVIYIVAMVVTVAVHAPGGVGVLEIIVIDTLTKDIPEDGSSLTVGVTCGIVLFRVIYYFIPGLVAGGLFMNEERELAKQIMVNIVTAVPRLIKFIISKLRRK